MYYNSGPVASMAHDGTLEELSKCVLKSQGVAAWEMGWNPCVGRHDLEKVTVMIVRSRVTTIMRE